MYKYYNKLYNSLFSLIETILKSIILYLKIKFLQIKEKTSRVPGTQLMHIEHGYFNEFSNLVYSMAHEKIEDENKVDSYIKVREDIWGQKE